MLAKFWKDYHIHIGVILFFIVLAMFISVMFVTAESVVNYTADKGLKSIFLCIWEGC